jgi:hypothetical protein
MSTNDEHAPAQRGGDSFMVLDHYERLIHLREESPDTYMLRTSEATRRALFHYERQKAQSRESER